MEWVYKILMVFYLSFIKRHKNTLYLFDRFNKILQG